MLTPQQRSEVCRNNRLGKKDSPASCALKSKRARERAARPGWYDRVSEGTKRAFAKPGMKEKIKIRDDKLRANATNPAFGLKVSKAVTEAMNRPEVKKKHLAGLRKARKTYGVNFGRDTLEKEFSKTLIPLGYVEQFSIPRGKGSGNRYVLDFALVNEKIAIELDGPKHRPYKQQRYDANRDDFLRSLGWKVIRVKHD